MRQRSASLPLEPFTTFILGSGFSKCADLPLQREFSTLLLSEEFETKLDNPAAVEVTIRFLRLPTPEGLMLELMQYHHPAGIVCCRDKVAHGLGCVGHIALRVKNIDEAFEHLRTVDGIRMINASSTYRPFKIDTIQPDEFRFYDETLEQNAKEKEEVCRIVGSIRYFYFLDPYGVQWELDQGHTDIGSE